VVVKKIDPRGLLLLFKLTPDIKFIYDMDSLGNGYILPLPLQLGGSICSPFPSDGLSLLPLARSIDLPV